MLDRTRHDSVSIIRLAHGKASALDTELLGALLNAFDEEAGSDSTAVVLTGTGSIFSAGVDLFRLLREGSSYVSTFYPLLTTTFRRLYELPKPVVAAVNGHAVAGGCILTAACDYRLMAQGRGRIGIPELHVGVPFPPFVLELMRSTVAPQFLLDVVYSGATYAPDDALQRGLIDEVTEGDRLESRAIEKALQLSSIAPSVFASTKALLHRPLFDAYQRLQQEEEAAQREWMTPQAAERISRYLEKTVPKKS